MSAPVRAGLFLAVLGTVFAAAYGVGRAFDGGEGAAAAEPSAGYQLRILEAPTAAAPRASLRFVIEDARGEAVTGFDLRHEKRLHLIAVDTGLTGYQHLHPTMATDGTWTTPMRVATGHTELYADFRPTGSEETVVRAGLDVPGTPGSSEFSKDRTQVIDGYSVTVLGDLAAGGTSDLRFAISRGGVPVDDLEPYLGAYGHLVALRKSDGEYLHVHPEDGPAGPEVAFAASVPTAARYHLYLDFQHGGKVRTAMFVLDASGGDGEGGHDGGHADAGHEDGGHEDGGHEDGGHGDH